MVREQKVRETERGGMGGNSGPRRLCIARVRGVLGYSICVYVHVRVCVSIPEWESKVLKLKGNTQTNSEDVGTLLMSEPFNTTRRNVPDREMGKEGAAVQYERRKGEEGLQKFWLHHQ